MSGNRGLQLFNNTWNADDKRSSIWELMDASRAWQIGAFDSLAVAYSVLAAVALVSHLIKIFKYCSACVLCQF